MTERSIKIWLWFAYGLVGLTVVTGIAVIIIVAHYRHPAAAVTEPCMSDSKPCIIIQDAAGHDIAKVNDFRFGPQQGCISYIELPGRMLKQYCGIYNLKWIGPEPIPGAKPGTV